MTANNRQVGGDHYQKTAKGGEQHWDRAWRLYREAWFVLNVTKYLERYREKEGIKDLEKAKHYLEKLIELEKADLEKKDPTPEIETHYPPTNGQPVMPAPKGTVIVPERWTGAQPTTVHLSLPVHWGTLCGAKDGGELTDQPEQVTCPRCILFMTYNQEETTDAS